MQEKVLEFWSPAPLLEGDAGKDATAPANLKKPEAADLEVSSDSFVGNGSDVEVTGASAPSGRAEAEEACRQEDLGLQGWLEECPTQGGLHRHLEVRE